MLLWLNDCRGRIGEIRPISPLSYPAANSGEIAISHNTHPGSHSQLKSCTFRRITIRYRRVPTTSLQAASGVRGEEKGTRNSRSLVWLAGSGGLTSLTCLGGKLGHHLAHGRDVSWSSLFNPGLVSVSGLLEVGEEQWI